MTLDDDALGWLYREGTRRASEDDCPAPEELRRLREPGLAEPQRSRLADHLATCSDCAEEFHLLASIESWAHDSAPVGDDEWARRFPYPQLAAAAAALVVVGISLLVWIARDGGRSGDAGAAGRPSDLRRVETATGRSVSPDHGAVLERAPPALSWEAEAGAIYRVELYDEESTRIWESERGRAGRVELPAGVAADLIAGRTYSWRVFAESGIERSRSELHRFEIAP